MISRNLLSVAIAALLSIFFNGDPAWTADQPSAPKEEVAASVDGKTITRAQLEEAYLKWKKSAEAGGRPVPEDQIPGIKKQILDQLINKELLIAESLRQKVSIPEKEVEEAFARMKKSFPQEEAFAQALEKSGMKISDLEKEIRNQLAIRKLIESKTAGELKVTDEETHAFYDKNKEVFKRQQEVRASHILVKVDNKAGLEADKKARDKIDGILKRIRKGDDFAAVAKETSEDPSASRGGDLGYFTKEKMVPEFSQTAFALQIDQTSEVVKSRFGYHIIKVTDIRPEEYEPYDQVKSQIIQFIHRQERMKNLKEYVDSLREKANIQIKF